MSNNLWGNWTSFDDLALDFGDFLYDTITFEPTNYSFDCPVLTQDYKDSPPILFCNTPSIIDAHLHSPRFGYTSNITKILVNERTTPADVEAANDYLYGVLISSIILFGFFLLWTIVLVVFKCLGYDRVGFLSGSNGPSTKKATTEGDEVEEAKVIDAIGDEDVGAEKELTVVVPEVEDQNDVKVVEAKVLLGGIVEDVDTDEAKSKVASEIEGTNLDVVNINATKEEQEKDKSDTGHDVENVTLKDYPTQTTQPQDMSIDKTVSDLATNDSIENSDDEQEHHAMKTSHAQSPSQPQSTPHNKTRVRRLRIALLVTGTCIVICSVIMIAKGVNGLWYTVNAGREGLVQGTNLAEKGVDIVDGLINTYNETIQAAKQLDLRKFCPSARDELCALNNPLYVAGDTCFQDADEVWNVLENNQKGIAEQVGSIKPDLIELDILLHDVNNQIKSFDWAFWVAGSAVLILAIITILQMIAMWLPYLSPQEVEKKSCGRKFLYYMKHSWFVVPLYIFVVIISWVFSTTFIIASMVSADFCYDSPNQRMVILLNSFGFYESLFSQFLISYVSNCKSNVVLDTLGAAAEFGLMTFNGVNEFAKIISSFANAIAIPCSSSPEAVQTAAVTLGTATCKLGTALYNFVEFFSCHNWNGLYAQVMYNTVCYNGATAFNWIATSEFLVVLFSMIFLTLRAGLLDDVEEGRDVGNAAAEDNIDTKKETQLEE